MLLEGKERVVFRVGALCSHVAKHVVKFLKYTFGVANVRVRHEPVLDSDETRNYFPVGSDCTRGEGDERFHHQCDV